MENKEPYEQAVAELDAMHYDMQEIANLAMQNLGQNKEYRRLLDQYDDAVRRRNLVKQTQLSVSIEKMKRKEMHRLIMLEEERRKDVEQLARILHKVNMADYNLYQELMVGLSLLLDMTDSIFFDINNLLRRNNLGIEIDNFPELKAARKSVQEMTMSHQRATARYKDDLWSKESESIYSHLLERCAVFREKVDRIEAGLESAEDR